MLDGHIWYHCESVVVQEFFTGQIPDETICSLLCSFTYMYKRKSDTEDHNNKQKTVLSHLNIQFIAYTAHKVLLFFFFFFVDNIYIIVVHCLERWNEESQWFSSKSKISGSWGWGKGVKLEHFTREGHLYFRLDIILVKGLSKHTLNTYFSGMTIDPKYTFLHAFFLFCSSCSFQNMSLWPKTHPFFQFCMFLNP